MKKEYTCKDCDHYRLIDKNHYCLLDYQDPKYLGKDLDLCEDTTIRIETKYKKEQLITIKADCVVKEIDPISPDETYYIELVDSTKVPIGGWWLSEEEVDELVKKDNGPDYG